MDYKVFLQNCAKKGITPGLETMTALMAALGNPQDKIKTIHITGTNGKGSCGAFLAGILQKKGYTVARYTSPAVFCEMEKYTINSIPAKEEDFGLCANEVAKACFDENISPSLFEAETAIAFLYFEKKQCDYAIIEVGMGGREDATNVIKAPVCSIITPISDDHMAFLGNSVELIAKEKCGIIKQGCPVVSAMQLDCVKEVITTSAQAQNSYLAFAKEAIYKGFDGQRQCFEYDGIDFEISALGIYQLQNAALAIEAAKVVDEFSKEEIQGGIRDVIWQGRFEVINQNPSVIIDGAHNVAGVLALCKSLEEYFPQREFNFVTATFKDKEYQKTTTIFAPMAKNIFAVETPNPRGLGSEEYAKSIKIHNKSTYNSTIECAIGECLKDKDAVTVCFGTLSFLSQIRQEVEKAYEKSE